MGRSTAKLFPNGRSQAVRLPKDFRFEGASEVFISKDRRGRVILEAKPQDFSALADVVHEFSEDFMAEGREQPPMQERDDL